MKGTSSFFDLLLEESPGLLLALDVRGNVLGASPSVAAALGRPPEDLNERPLTSLLAPEERGRFPVLWKAILDDKGYSGSLVVETREGDERTWRMEGVVRRVSGGEPTVILHGQDVTEALREREELSDIARLSAFSAEVGRALTRGHTLQEALKESAEAMAQHLAGAWITLWSLEPGEELALQAGAGHAGRVGAIPERIPVGKYRIGATARDREPLLADIGKHDSLVDGVYSKGMKSFAGFPLIAQRRLVGVLALYSERALSVAVVEALTTVADELALGIDRWRTAEAQRAGERTTRAVIEHMRTGLLILREDGVLESANPAAEAVFGFGSGELAGQALSSLLTEVKAEDASHLRSALGQVTETTGRRKSGETFPLELSLFEFETPEGHRFGANVIDVSTGREIERLRKEVVATVSHELREPLTSIQGSLALMSSGLAGELPEEAKELVAIAERNSERLLRLVSDIVDLERIAGGGLDMNYETVVVSQMIDRCVEAVWGLAQQRNVEVEKPSGATETIYADGERLEQALINILSNAVKFSPPGGRVTITVEDGDNWVEIRVTDQGRGVPAAFQKIIFERFRHVDPADTRMEGGGTGLGLAIAKAVVERHEGKIGVESQEGHGSTFWFRIPVALGSPTSLLSGRMDEAGVKRRFFGLLPRYEPLETLGVGGMGMVFRAKDRDLDEEVAIKVLLNPAELAEHDLLSRFKREINLNRKIKHPNVARLHDFGTVGEFHFITMEYIPGRDMNKLIVDDGRISAESAVPLLRQVALGAGAAHKLGIIHRDLKPQNIMIDEEGGVALLDFGLSRRQRDPSLTDVGMVVGTVEYMSPEQLKGEPIDARSDIYAIGVVAFAALTGQLPFTGDSPAALALAHINDPVPIAVLRRVGVPQPLIDVLVRCLAKAPEDRYQTAEELESDLALLTLGPDAEARGGEAGADVVPVDSSGVALPPALSPPSRPKPIRTRKPVTLVVDDDETFRMLIKLHLEKEGCEVRTAADGQEALEKMMASPADLILMDVMMPVMDGFDALRVLRSQPSLAKLPIILMSGFLERNRFAFALQAGATDFVPKPIDFPVLIDKVRRLLLHEGFELKS